MITNTSKLDPTETMLGLMLRKSAYVEMMEARGQEELIHSSVLPEPDEGRASYEALGFVWGEPVGDDDLFTHVTLPDGWTKAASDHPMWSHIYDADGVERVAVFYKAAFYDRRAFMRLSNDAV